MRKSKIGLGFLSVEWLGLNTSFLTPGFLAKEEDRVWRKLCIVVFEKRKQEMIDREEA